MKYNSRQKQAITHETGPLLIVAGAGTGKTSVITGRIKHLIQTKQVDPYHIFAATFTQKAAEEMHHRLSTVMPYGYLEPWLGTFHSLCDRLLKIEGLEVGLNINFKIMSQADQWLFLKSHLRDLKLGYYRPLGNPDKFISALITFFSRLQDDDISPAEFATFLSKHPPKTDDQAEVIEHERLLDLAQAYQRYESCKQEAAVLDYGDLMTYTLRLFRTRPNILAKYQQTFKHLLIDEFQDTNYAQFELIKLLAPPNANPNLVVVGDDDQSIYKFRGASIANILEFKAIYPQAKEVVLIQNYRSSQPILDAAYRLISANNPQRLEIKLGLDKHLKSQAQPKVAVTPQVIESATLDQEVDFTIQTIAHLNQDQGLEYQDIAILARANAHLEPYALALKNAGIPYQLIANYGLYDQPEVRDLINLLRVIIDPEDSLSLFSLSQSSLSTIPTNFSFNLLANAKKTSQSLWDVFQASEAQEIQDLVSLITTSQKKAAKTNVSRLLYDLISSSGYIEQFLTQETLENQLKLTNINKFFDKVKQFEAVNQDKSVLHFVQTLELWLEAGENPGQAQIEDVDTVKLMTIHAAKGLEFSAVFLGNLIAGRFPSSNRRDAITVPDALIKETLPTGNVHLQEERRLFYVALTRAKSHLYLTYALDVGGARKRIPSGFIAETGLPITLLTTDASTSMSRPPPSNTTSSPLLHPTITTLSYSQLATFKKCPLRYKYRYLLHVPAKPHHSAAYGQTIHATLETFHRHEMHGDPLSLPMLLEVYQACFINEGYESKSLRQEMYAAGEAALTAYYDRYRQILAKPYMLEQRFRIKFGDVYLVGKIDRIDQLSDDTYEIIDYKTGSPANQKSVDKNDQLGLYALAAKEALGIEANHLSLLYLDNGGTKISSTRTQKQLDQTKKRLTADIEVIKQSAFPPKPSDFTCRHCEYRKICPFAVT
jgi:DNA helicase II / ATP-dependent DNA helicase PcrA